MDGKIAVNLDDRPTVLRQLVQDGVLNLDGLLEINALILALIQGECEGVTADDSTGDVSDDSSDDAVDDSTDDAADDSTGDGTDDVAADDSSGDGTDDTTGDGTDDAAADDSTGDGTDDAAADDSTCDGTDDGTDDAAADDSTGDDTDDSTGDGTDDAGDDGSEAPVIDLSICLVLTERGILDVDGNLDLDLYNLNQLPRILLDLVNEGTLDLGNIANVLVLIDLLRDGGCVGAVDDSTDDSTDDATDDSTGDATDDSTGDATDDAGDDGSEEPVIDLAICVILTERDILDVDGNLDLSLITLAQLPDVLLDLIDEGVLDLGSIASVEALILLLQDGACVDAADAADDSTGDATDDATDDSTGDATDDATDDSTGDATDDATDDSTGDATDDATDDSTGDATDDATDDSTGDATDDATDDSTGDATDDATDDSTGDATDDSTGDATDDATDDSTGDATDDATDDSTGDATDDATDDSTGDATDDATDDSTGDATDDAADDSTGDATDDATDDSTGDATDDATDDSTDDATDDATDDSTGDATDDATDDSTGDASDDGGADSDDSDDGADQPTGLVTTNAYECAEVGDIYLEYKNSSEPAEGAVDCQPGSVSLTFTSIETGETYSMSVGAGVASPQMNMPMIQMAESESVTIAGTTVLEIPAGMYNVGIDGTGVNLDIQVAEGEENPQLVVSLLAGSQSEPAPETPDDTDSPDEITGLPSTGSGIGNPDVLWPVAAVGAVMLMLVGHFVIDRGSKRSWAEG